MTMYRKFFRVIMILMLALGMASGSFIASLAASEPADSSQDVRAEAAVTVAEDEPEAIEADAPDSPEEPEVDDFMFDPATMYGPSHTTGEIEEDFTIPATCTEAGIIYHVLWCKWHYREVATSYTEEIIPALGHTPAEAVEENRIEPTCDKPGSYDMAVYCEVCGEELSRETVVLPALGHTHGKPVEENRVEPSDGKDGSYDTVVYCTVCGTELSREHNVIVEEIEFIEPKTLTIRDGASIYTAVIDEDGYAEFEDFLTELDPGSNASEKISMSVGGKTYTFTRYADGKVTGKLPAGFSIKDGTLRIKNADSNLSIKVNSRSATSSAFQAGDDGESVGVIDSGYSAPEVVLPAYMPYEEPANNNGGGAGRGGNSADYNNNGGGYGYNAGAGTYGQGYTYLGDYGSPAVESETQTADANANISNEDIFDEIPLFKSAPQFGSNSEDDAAAEDNTASKLLILADLTLVFGLLIGLLVLWRMGLFRSR